MAPKFIVCAAIAGLAIAACTTPGPGGIGTMGGAWTPVVYECRTNPCDIEVKHPFVFRILQLADQIDVYVPRPMTIRWKLTGSTWTKFNPSGGIAFTSPGFSCAIDPTDAKIFACENSAPASVAPYKYGIKTKGFGSPPDIDPWVVNK